MKYLKIFEDFERSAYTKISPKTLIRGNKYLQEVCPFLNIDLYEDVDVVPGGNFLYDSIEYDSIESLIKSVYENALSIWDYRQHKYTINNGFIDVKGSVDIDEKNLYKIPYKFGKVSLDFSCNQNQLTTLVGAPHTVSRDFSCYENKLTTLEGGPHTVGNNFNCSSNQLTTLKGGPHTVGCHYWCEDNQLTTLEGAPQTVDGNLDIRNNKLTNLKYLPKKIGININCRHNPNLTDFSDVPVELVGKIMEDY